MSTTTSNRIDNEEALADNSGWGWDPSVTEESLSSSTPIILDADQKLSDESSQVKSVKSLKSFDSKHYALKVAADSLKSGMTSSPSFQELERAIGATLALSLNGSEVDNSYSSRNSGMPKLGSFNTIYQKAQKSMKVKFNPRQAREELAYFIHETESRALIVFHSPDTAPNIIRDSCQKYGALYYIRPEFHNRGVTFISYSDVRNAVTAFRNLPKDLGSSTSIHYSVMLHGTANNSEEHKLLIKNLPPKVVEGELESIFSQYGEVRSIERKHSLDAHEVNSAADHDLSNNMTVYVVEYFNVQDARSAVSELCATSFHIWGAATTIAFFPISSQKQSLLRQLLSILSRWRSESAYVAGPPASYGRIPNYLPQPMPMMSSYQGNFVNPADIGEGIPNFPVNAGYLTTPIPYQMPTHNYSGIPDQHVTIPPAPFPINQSYSHHPQNQSVMPAHLQQEMPQIDGQNLYSYHADVDKVTRPQAPMTNGIHYRKLNDSRPQHHTGGVSNHLVRNRNKGVLGQASNVETEFVLDLNRIEARAESRTTVMVSFLFENSLRCLLMSGCHRSVIYQTSTRSACF
jgi:RNA recognition motif-containing protein